VRNALISQLHQCGMKPLPNSEKTILDWFAGRGVTCSAEPGYLVLTQQDGSAAVPSAACETLRKEMPQLFLPDPRRDSIVCLQDMERGTPLEIARAKSAYLKAHGQTSYENLPRTREQAERRAVVPHVDMTRKEYLQLSLSDKSALAGAIGAAGIAKIMSRQG